MIDNSLFKTIDNSVKQKILNLEKMTKRSDNMVLILENSLKI